MPKFLSYLNQWLAGSSTSQLGTVLLLALGFDGGKGAEGEEEGNKCNLEPVLSLT
jgi:hypothetical protein